MTIVLGVRDLTVEGEAAFGCGGRIHSSHLAHAEPLSP